MFDMTHWDQDYVQSRFADSYILFRGELLRYRSCRRVGRGEFEFKLYPKSHGAGAYRVDMAREPIDFGINGDIRPDDRRREDYVLASNRDDQFVVNPRYGMTNVEVGGVLSAIMVRRRAVRRDWRQGIRANQLRAGDRGTGFCSDFIFGSKKGIALLEESLTNRFDTVSQAEAKVMEEYDSCALSLSFAVDQDGKLLFEDRGPVGRFENDRRVRLARNWSFLKEQFNKEVPDVRIS